MGRYGFGGVVLLFILGSNLGGVGPEMGRGEGRSGVPWQDYCGSMLRSEFTRMYRMDSPTFAYLVDALAPHINRNLVQADRGTSAQSCVSR